MRTRILLALCNLLRQRRLLRIVISAVVLALSLAGVVTFEKEPVDDEDAAI